MAKSTDTHPQIDVARLAMTDAGELQALHRNLFGAEHAVSNAGHLRRKIAWHLQAFRDGGLPQSAIEYAQAIARDAQLRVRISENAARRRKAIPLDRTATTAVIPEDDARIPMPGALLVREFKDRTAVVKVLDDGFEYEGRRFRSLSAVAHAITGTKWNGPVFFGLTREKALAS
ncbi:MAG TPA: DUF2924 domain-containing protein [Bryobacteraceae bacterium]|nr:DUF2924 domain-containing protein [Bryobacteraceae bacterium]